LIEVCVDVLDLNSRCGYCAFNDEYVEFVVLRVKYLGSEVFVSGDCDMIFVKDNK